MATMLRQAVAMAAALACVVNARGIRPPTEARETQLFNFPLDQISPIPTPGPMNPLELARRQASSSSPTTALVAPDNTCGYISDRPGASFFCPATMTCVFFTARSTASGAIACCNPEACNLRITCLDFNQISSSSLCDAGCKVDQFTLKCTDSRLPFCNTISFSSNIIDYWCNDASITGFQSAATSYTGQSANRVFSPLVLSDASTTGSRALGLSRSVSSIPTATNNNQGNNNDGDSDNDNGDGGGGGAKKKSSTGAIAGGVVGGIAAIAALGAGVLFLLKKKRQQDGKPADVPGNNFPPPMQQQSPIPPQQPSPMGYTGTPSTNQSMYDPHFAQMNQPPQQYQAYPPPPQQDTLSPQQYQQGYYAGAVPPDRHDSTSPMSEGNRMSQQPLGSPHSSQGTFLQGQPYPQQQQFQQQQPTIHEAGGAAVDHHRGRMHELA